MANQPSFEIPPELRDLAEKNVEQARAAYGQFMDFLTQAMGAWAGTAGAETAGFTTVQEKAVAFAKENAERAFALASDLARAKDVQEVLTLQSRYAQTQMQTFGVVESVKAVSDLFAPLTGVVVEVNQDLTREPERVNRDPYGGGWLIVVELAHPAEAEKLMTAPQYEEFLKTAGGH